MTEEINLGEFITLKGFHEEDGSTMVAVKKIVGSYVKKIMDTLESFQDITVTLKRVHGHEKDGKIVGGKYEIHIKVNAGKVFTAENTEHNLFVTLDKTFKKIIAEF